MTYPPVSVGTGHQSSSARSGRARGPRVVRGDRRAWPDAARPCHGFFGAANTCARSETWPRQRAIEAVWESGRGGQRRHAERVGVDDLAAGFLTDLRRGASERRKQGTAKTGAEVPARRCSPGTRNSRRRIVSGLYGAAAISAPAGQADADVGAA